MFSPPTRFLSEGHSNTWDRLQLLGADSSSIDPVQINDAFERWNLGNVVSNYAIVSIEGNQSSGKSSLLNGLFGTQFEVMDPAQMQQTTKGIWMAPVRGSNMIVLDAEGSDSRERHTRGDAASERKTLAFTLVHANVLLINIWKQQLSSYNGAGLPLLQPILERNLQLFPRLSDECRNISKKVLLFVIVNNDNRTPFKQLTELLQTNIEHIWRTIQPAGSESIYDYFVLEFHSLPHYIYMREEYDTAVISLRSRFHDGPGGLLAHAAGANIPIAALASFMQLNHAVIQADEVLNLPSQRQIVLERHVSEIAKKKLNWLRDEGTTELKRLLAEGRPVDGLGSILGDLFKSSLDHYTSSTAGFDVPSHERYMEDLRLAVLDILEPLYHRNISNLQATLEEQFSAQLDILVSLREFLEKAEESKKEKQQAFFQAQSEALQTDWVNHAAREDLDRRLDRIKVTGQISSRLQPMTWSQQNVRVGRGKYMSTRAELYGDGRLVLEVFTNCDNLFHGLRGNVQAFSKDKNGNTVASTPSFRCTTRGGGFDPTTESDGLDTFSHKFATDIPGQTAHLEIRQWE